MKKQFMDTDLGFSIKIFGSVLLANILVIILQFVFTTLDELIGEFIVTFITVGMGIMVYVTCIYSTAWQKGFRDLGLVSRDLTVFKSARGLYCGLIASIPSFILYILLVLGGLFSDQLFGISKVLFMVYHPHPFFLINALINSFDLAFLLCIIFIIPLPLITWLGYNLGHKNILITKLMMYSRKKDGTE